MTQPLSIARVLLGLLVAGSVGSAFAAQIGDTYEQVLAEKGVPASHVEAGALRIVNYPDASFRFKGDRVVEIRKPEPVRPAAPRPAPPPPVKAPPPVAYVEPSADQAPVEWTSDYQAARDRAQAENRNVFLLFTGSDWCKWCQRLHREVLATPEFRAYAQSKLVLVKLDFPRRIQLSDDVKAQNAALASEFGIKGYPTVIILDSHGQVLLRTGYEEGGPAPYIATLSALD